MGNNLTNFLLIILLILVLALIMFIRPKTTIEPLIEKQIDTIVVRQTKNDTIRLVKTKVLKKIQFDTITIKDTLILKPNFEINVDTVIVKDTLKLFYSFPKDSLFVEIKKEPEKTIIIEKQPINVKKKSEKFFENENFFIFGSFVFGVIVGLLVK